MNEKKAKIIRKAVKKLWSVSSDIRKIYGDNIKLFYKRTKKEYLNYSSDINNDSIYNALVLKHTDGGKK
jgi:hypothetical protein